MMPSLDRLRRWSLATRLMVLSLLATSIGTSIGGWMLRERLHLAVERGLESQLKSRMESLVAHIESTGIYVTRSNRLDQGDFGRIFSGWYWMLRRGDDGYRSRSSWDSTMAADQARDLYGDGRLWVMADPVGRQVAGVTHRWVLEGVEAQLYVFGPMDEVLAERRHIDRVLLTTQLVLLISLAGLTVLVVRTGLAPLRRLQQRLDRVQSGQEHRVGQGFGPDLDPLAATVDQMLQRNTKVIERARHQAADLSHALKKPLTILGMEARKDTVPGEWLQEQVYAMSHTIDRHLARFGSGAGGGDWVDVGAVVQRIVGLIEQIHAERGLVWSVVQQGVEGVRWQGGASDLEEMLGNLLDNAGKWAAHRVEVGAVVHEQALTVSIEDDGTGLSSAQLDAVAQRGLRFDEGVQGHGLGLAIVRDIAETYGGELTIGPGTGRGLRCVLRLPLRWASPLVSQPLG